VYDVLGKVMDGSTPVTIFHDLLKTESYQFPKGSLRMRFNTNHDKNAWDGPAVEKFTQQGAKATAVLMFTYPGIPLIYNGEEVANTKRLGLFEKTDIDWLKNSDFRKLYEKLSLLRKQHPALVNGSYSVVQNSEYRKVLSFLRVKGEDSVLVVINFGSAMKCTLVLPSNSYKSWKDFFTDRIYYVMSSRCNVELPSLGFVVILSKEKF
jgi:glycosidase